MKTVHAVSALTGISVRTLQYYDQIGLLHPSRRTAAGYRLYSDADLDRLQQILLFRELAFPLKDIKTILENPVFDRQQALSRQIELLTLKRDRLNRLIQLARKTKEKGSTSMDFSPFDSSEFDACAAEAKAQWGSTAAYKEFEAKTAKQNPAVLQNAGDGLMQLLAVFGTLQTRDVSDPAVQQQVQALQKFITTHFYTCTNEILAGLGNLYAAGGDFTQNINRAGGAGTAEYAARAIAWYCKSASERSGSNDE